MNYFKELYYFNPNNKADAMELKIYYDLGGMNYFSGGNRPRGLYLSITPLIITGGFTQYSAYTGIYQCLKTLKRQSDKEGKSMADKFRDKAEYLAKCFYEKNNTPIIDFINQLK
jgi:hypothetical protein